MVDRTAPILNRCCFEGAKKFTTEHTEIVIPKNEAFIEERNERKSKLIPLPLSFYQSDDVVDVAKKLLGKGLFTEIGGHLTGGIIIETEAYAGAGDRASHAYGNRRTKRTETMFQKGGIAYVYLCYGIHSLLNAVTADEDIPHAVLIRAIQPTAGIDLMLKRRKKTTLEGLASGPGALTAALGITLAHNASPLNSESLWIADLGIESEQIISGPRIGVDYAGPDALLPYRFLMAS